MLDSGKVNAPAGNDVDRAPVPMSTEEFDALVERLYPRLRALAAQIRWRGPSATQPTSILHDAYLRLRRSKTAGSISSKDILLVFAHVMRQVMVDGARRTKAAKRGGGAQVVSLVEDGPSNVEPMSSKAPVSREEILTLDAALKQLRLEDARQAEIVDLRYFLGLTAEEAGAILGVALTTVEREWRTARAFLRARIDPVRK